MSCSVCYLECLESPTWSRGDNREHQIKNYHPLAGLKKEVPQMYNHQHIIAYAHDIKQYAVQIMNGWININCECYWVL